MFRSRLFGFLPLALLAMPGCVPPESTCKESELSGWSVSAPEYSQPIRCDAKIVGHQLDIDATDARVGSILRYRGQVRAVTWR